MFRLGALLLASLLATLAQAAPWSTPDGLTITLDDATGAVRAVVVDGRELPLSAPGGALSYREFSRPAEDSARTAVALDFEDEAVTWTSAHMADWDSAEVYAERRTDGAATGSGYLRLKGAPGAGMATPQSFELPEGAICRITWQARSRSTGQLYILCLRLFDAAGNDITASAAPPRGWTYTPYSNAHYRIDLANTKPETWESFRCEYLAPRRTARARLSLRLYTGEDVQGDIDDLRVSVLSGWGPEVPVVGPVRNDSGELVQRARPEDGLSFVTRYTGQAGHLAAQVQVTSDRPRCLRLSWRLPLALEGWTWENGPLSPQRITATSDHFAGEPFSRYWLVSVHDAQTGIALAAPCAEPALQTFAAAADGVLTRVDLGVTPQAPRARAAFGLELMRHDPAWGFRAALERYYALHPELGEVRSRARGCWTLRLPAPETPNLEDFRLAYYECGAASEQEVQFCREHGIEMYRYSEPWGLRQYFPGISRREDLPAYQERGDQLRAWAADVQSDRKWLGLPRARVAQAVLNSLMPGPDGVAVYLDDYYDSWATWWQLNSDPDLPAPNRATIAYESEITPALAWADGIYLDSVSLYLFMHEDHDPVHIAAADRPLAFSTRSGQPVVLAALAHYEFIERLQAELRAQGKLLMMNIFPPATRVYGHMADVAGSETVGPQQDEEAMQLRVAAWRRPVSNLLQWQSAVLKRVPAWTPEQAREYFDNQLLYGFWPGISTAGGGSQPGYAGMNRYFRDPELLERDRPLWQEYMPVFDALNAAGWEPVPHVRCDPPTLRVERFGTAGTVYLTVHNPAQEPVVGTLSLERAWWTATLGTGVKAALMLPAGGCELVDAGDALRIKLSLQGRQTVVVALRP